MGVKTVQQVQWIRFNISLPFLIVVAGITERVISDKGGTTITEKYSNGERIERTTVTRREDEPAVATVGRAGTVAREPVTVRTEKFARGGERAGDYIYKRGEKMYDRTRSGTLVRTDKRMPRGLAPIAKPKRAEPTPGRVKREYVRKPGPVGGVLSVVGQAKDIGTEVTRGAAGYITGKLRTKQEAAKEQARITQLEAEGKIKPLPEALAEAEALYEKGDITKAQHAEWKEQVLAEVAAKVKGPTLGGAAELTGAVILGTAAGGFAPELLGRSAFVGGALGVTETVGAGLRMAPSIPLRAAGWSLKFATTALVTGEAWKAWEAWQELGSPAERVGALVGAVPSMYIGAKAYKVTSQLVYIASKPFVVQRAVSDDLALIERASKEGHGIIDTTLKTDVKDIPVIRTRDYFLTGDLPDELKDSFRQLRYEGVHGTKGKIVSATEVPAKIWRVYTEGTRTVEVMTDIKTGRIAAMIYEGVSPTSTLYIFEPKGVLNVYQVTTGAAKLTKFFTHKFKPEVATEVITPTAAYSTAKMEALKLGWEYQEVGKQYGEYEAGIGRGAAAKIKLEYAKAASISQTSTDVYFYKQGLTIKELPSSGVLYAVPDEQVGMLAARVYTTPPELFVAQVTRVDYSLGTPVYQDYPIGPGSVRDVVVSLRGPALGKSTPSGMEAAQYAPITIDLGAEALRTMQRGYDLEMFRVARDRAQAAVTTVTVMEQAQAVAPIKVTIPKTVVVPPVVVEAIHIPAVAVSKVAGVGFKPLAFAEISAVRQIQVPKVISKVMPVTKTKQAQVTKLKTDLKLRVRAGAKVATALKTKLKVKTKMKMAFTQAQLTLLRSGTKLAQLPVQVAVARAVVVPPAAAFRTPQLPYKGFRMPTLGLPSFVSPTKVPKRHKIKMRKVKRPRRPKTFLAFPDPLSIFEGKLKYGKFTAPPQTRALRRRYRREVLFSPLVATFPTLEQLRARKKKKKRRKKPPRKRRKKKKKINRSRRFSFL